MGLPRLAGVELMLSIIITAHHDDLGLYLTYFSVVTRLEAANVLFEVIIVADGGTEQKFENRAHTRVLRGVFGSPQASRDAGVRAARYPTALLLESHIILSDPMRLVAQHELREAALTFPCRQAEGPEMFDVYGQEVDWGGNLWHKRLVYKPFDNKPYRVAQFGHSCFALDREWYLQSGGYTNLMTGWGGEEPFLALKAWMLGRECWLVPDVYHAHYLTPGAHAGVSHSADFRRNFDVLAYVIAGRQNQGFAPTPADEAERRRIAAGPFEGNVVRLKQQMDANGVLN